MNSDLLGMRASTLANPSSTLNVMISCFFVGIFFYTSLLQSITAGFDRQGLFRDKRYNDKAIVVECRRCWKGMGVRIGTSGFSYPHWRGVFYPYGLHQSKLLQYYQECFDTVEINTTFYRLPRPDTFLNWGKSVRPDFMFALKASRLITHLKRLKNVEAELSRFLESAMILGDRLGPVLYQLPPSLTLDIGRLSAFLSLLPGNMRHAVEFRHPSWFVCDVRNLLVRQGVSFCISDGPDGHQSPDWVSSQNVYMRFHGPEWQYGGQYPSEQLVEWAKKIERYVKEGLSVVAFFNNDAQGYAVNDAKQLKSLLSLV